MTGADGAQVTVGGFFAQANPPELVGSDGAQISGEVATQLAGAPAGGESISAGTDGSMIAQNPTMITGTDGEPIGNVENLSGTVFAVRTDGTRVELKIGDSVFQGDIIESSGDGAVGVLLADETTFSMGNNGRIVLDEMIYDPATQSGSVGLSVMQGVFTFVSGQVAKTDPDAMTLDTPVATIGIRGTQVGLDLPQGKDMKVVLMEEKDGFVGEVVIANSGGVQVMNGANQSTSIASFDAKPAPVRILTVNELVASFGSALRQLPKIHGNQNDFGLQQREGTQNQEQKDEKKEKALDEEVKKLDQDAKAAEEAQKLQTDAGKEKKEEKTEDVKKGDDEKAAADKAAEEAAAAAAKAAEEAAKTAAKAAADAAEAAAKAAAEAAAKAAADAAARQAALDAQRAAEEAARRAAQAAAKAAAEAAADAAKKLVDNPDDPNSFVNRAKLANDTLKQAEKNLDELINTEAGAGRFAVGEAWDAMKQQLIDTVELLRQETNTANNTLTAAQAQVAAAVAAALGAIGDNAFTGRNGAFNALNTIKSVLDLQMESATDAAVDLLGELNVLINGSENPPVVGALQIIADSDWVGTEGDDFMDVGDLNVTGQTIDGGAGDDIIFARAGDDVVLGGEGNDILDGGAGADVLDGGAGVDTASYAESLAGVIVNLASGQGFGGDAEGDTLINIENLTGSSFSDVLTGNDGDNVLVGGGGDDVLAGGGGDDVLIGGEGNDVMIGGEGKDTVIIEGAFGNFTFSRADDGTISVTRAGGPDLPSETDTISGVELINFDDETIGVVDAVINEDNALPLDITGALGGDTAEAASIVISGVPAGATLSVGSFDAATNTWTLSPEQVAAGVTVTPLLNSNVDFSLTVTEIGADGSQTGLGFIDVDVKGIADLAFLDSPDVAVNAGVTSIPLDIRANLTDLDGSESLSVTISGVPDG
ncbi:MAG: FecR domain-containing protein, partial [Rhodospirillales bacterium]|nr:FecR domain-containing protein [Rhodospirillales bacterium]